MDENYFTAYRQFTVEDGAAEDGAAEDGAAEDGAAEDATQLEARQAAAVEDATQELYDKIGPNNLADFLPFPTWTVEPQPAEGETPAQTLYKLKVKILFKP